MRHYINKLRQKPEKERKNILLLVSFGIVFLILLLWLMTFGFFYNDTSSVKTSEKVGPFTLLKNSIKAMVQNAEQSANVLQVESDEKIFNNNEDGTSKDATTPDEEESINTEVVPEDDGSYTIVPVE